MYEQNELLKGLRTSVVDVHFTKANGESRVLRCTLLPSMLPESYRKSFEEQNEEKTFHQQNPNVIAAWDVEKNAWRSFRIESVTYCQAHHNS